jgi:hypothetical protein
MKCRPVLSSVPNSWVVQEERISRSLPEMDSKKKPLWNRPEGLKGGEEKMKFIFPYLLQHTCQETNKTSTGCINVYFKTTRHITDSNMLLEVYLFYPPREQGVYFLRSSEVPKFQGHT